VGEISRMPRSIWKKFGEVALPALKTFLWKLVELSARFVGLGVTLAGNRVNYHGNRMSVDNPAVTQLDKGLMVYGLFEAEELEAVRRYLDPALPVIEFGGFIGCLACAANKLLDDPARHIVVEANPQVIPKLETNRNSNDCQFVVLHGCIAYGADHVYLYQSGVSSSVESANHKGDPVEVPTATLSSVVQQYDTPVFSLICDIEGAEVDLVREEAALIEKSAHTIIIEIHSNMIGSDRVDWLLSRFGELGFVQVHRELDVHVFRNVALSG